MKGERFLWGVGAVHRDKWRVGMAGAAAGVMVVYGAVFGLIPGVWWQLVLLGIIAVDLGAGLVANLLPSCKSFYHSPIPEDAPWWEKLVRHPMGFVAFHIYPLILWAVFPANLIFGVIWYLLLLLSAWIVFRIPDRAKRPVAGGVLVWVLMLNALVIPHPEGLSWFMPMLFLKLVLGHLIRVH